jgi:hypothetical protein
VPNRAIETDAMPEKAIGPNHLFLTPASADAFRVGRRKRRGALTYLYLSKADGVSRLDKIIWINSLKGTYLAQEQAN